MYLHSTLFHLATFQHSSGTYVCMYVYLRQSVLEYNFFSRMY